MSIVNQAYIAVYHGIQKAAYNKKHAENLKTTVEVDFALPHWISTRITGFEHVTREGAEAGLRKFVDAFKNAHPRGIDYRICVANTSAEPIEGDVWAYTMRWRFFLQTDVFYLQQVPVANSINLADYEYNEQQYLEVIKAMSPKQTNNVLNVTEAQDLVLESDEQVEDNETSNEDTSEGNDGTFNGNGEWVEVEPIRRLSPASNGNATEDFVDYVSIGSMGVNREDIKGSFVRNNFPNTRLAQMVLSLLDREEDRYTTAEVAAITQFSFGNHDNAVLTRYRKEQRFSDSLSEADLQTAMRAEANFQTLSNYLLV
jgi:hypothetical protein